VLSEVAVVLCDVTLLWRNFITVAWMWDELIFIVTGTWWAILWINWLISHPWNRRAEQKTTRAVTCWWQLSHVTWHWPFDDRSVSHQYLFWSTMVSLITEKLGQQTLLDSLEFDRHQHHLPVSHCHLYYQHANNWCSCNDKFRAWSATSLDFVRLCRLLETEIIGPMAKHALL
jgi:hypothetical protein